MKDDKNLSTKMQIINCALHLFKEKGTANVTVNDICKEIGITRSTFYYYFKSRDEIFDEYFLFPNVYINDHLLSILQSTNYLEQFYTIYSIYLERDIYNGYEVLGQVLKRNIDQGLNLFVPKNVPVWEIYVTLIKKAQAAGQILNPKPAEKLVDAAIYAGDGIALIWCTSKGQIDIREETKRIFDILFMVPNEYALKTNLNLSQEVNEGIEEKTHP